VQPSITKNKSNGTKLVNFIAPMLYLGGDAFKTFSNRSFWGRVFSP
jgi:hypothetical protein